MQKSSTEEFEPAAKTDGQEREYLSSDTHSHICLRGARSLSPGQYKATIDHAALFLIEFGIFPYPQELCIKKHDFSRTCSCRKTMEMVEN